jgi:hypothetical protein
LFTRIRDLEDGRGARLRVSMSAHPSGAKITLERRDQPHRPSAQLGLHGVEILNGFLMSARLSAPYPMPDEEAECPFPARFRLECAAQARVVIEQEDRFPLAIDAPLWDRLYAELCLVVAHGRALAHRDTYDPVRSLH